jgi:hypothetical protein
MVTDGLICTGCGRVYLEPVGQGQGYCPRCDSDLRVATLEEINALPEGCTVSPPPLRPGRDD